MHESGLAARLVEAAEEAAARAGAGRVTGLRVVVGPLAGVAAGHLAEDLRELCAGSDRLAAAAVEVVVGVDPLAAGAAGVVLERVIVEG